MSSTLFSDLSSYFNNIDPEDPIYQKDLIRPAEIKEDVKLMEQRKRVSNIMRSKLFKKDLENIFLKYKFDEDETISNSDLSLADISNQLLLSAIPKNKIESLNQLNSKKGIICINDLSSAGTGAMYGNTEKQTRCKLAAVFRLIDMYGWNSSFNVVMTARPFADKEHFLINPFGLMFHEITASALISVDFRGNILDFGSTVLEANPIAWVVHSALYSCRNNIRAIFELKTPAAIAISSLDCGLLPICREAIVLGPFSILHESPAAAGVGAGDESKPSNLVQADWKNYLSSVMVSQLKVLIVPNCGIVICGETIEEAWHLAMNCQIACETQLKLGNLHMDDLYIPDKAAQTELFNQWRSTDIGGITPMANANANNSNQTTPAQWRLGEMEFEALMRHMDNNGYRTGYFYRQEYILQSDKPTKTAHDGVKYGVEIPPSSISTIETTKQSPEDESKTSRSFNRSKSDKWFNTPNMYRLIEDTEEADNKLPYNFRNVQSNKKSARWASTKVPNFSAPTPQHPVTAGAYVAIGYQPSKSDNREKSVSKINPKELIENQKRVKNKYYHDTNTAGPISCLLDSEEARMMKSESLRKQIGLITSSNDQVITAASKGIIQRGHKAVVYQDLFKSGNPFDVTADELADYHKEVDRKLHPDRYKSVEIKDDTQSKEEAPEIRITLSPTESSLPPPDSDIPDASTSRRDTELSNRKSSTNEHVKLPPNECHPFFQSDFDEDFNNLKISETVCTSSPKKRDTTDEASRSNELPSFNLSGDSTQGASIEGLKKSASMKNDKKKSFRSFSFKSLRRSPSAKESAEILENKGATLAAPGYGTITSETSGVDISNDELDKDTKKKKKRKFKLPSFSKKKKDKSK